MHGFFLLHASHTHGKVSLSVIYILALYSLFQFWFMDQPLCRTSEAFSWCSCIFVHQDSQSHARHELSSTNVICRKRSWIRGWYNLYLELFCFSAQTSQQFNSGVYLCQVSDTHDQLLEVLSSLNFNTQEFILSPLQFGVPYSRPRYFCLVRTFYCLTCYILSWHFTTLIFIFICPSLLSWLLLEGFLGFQGICCFW